MSNPYSEFLKLATSAFLCSSLHPSLSLRDFSSLKTTGTFTKMLLISISSRAEERSATESREKQEEMSSYEKTGDRTVSALRKSLAMVQEGLKTQRQQNQKKDLKNLHIFWPIRVKLEWQGKQSRPQEGCFFRKDAKCFSLRFQLRYQFSVCEFFVRHLSTSTNTTFFFISLEMVQTVSIVKFYPRPLSFSQSNMSSSDPLQNQHYFTVSCISSGSMIHSSISCWQPLRNPNTLSNELASFSFFLLYPSSCL